MPLPGHVRKSDAFTLVEMLVVVAIIGVLASLLLAGLDKAKEKARATKCSNNVRQLQLGWQIYTADSQDYLVRNALAGTFSGKSARNPSWVSGEMSWYPMDDNTNRDNLTGKGRFGSMGAYVSPGVYKCPSDRVPVAYPSGLYERNRSYSLNSYMGTLEDVTTPVLFVMNGPNRIYKKMSDISVPSEAFTFIEQHADSINDGAFQCNLESDRFYWAELPASLHTRGCYIGFADGQVTFHRWTDIHTRPPVTQTFYYSLGFATYDDTDVPWLYARATERK